MKSYHLKLTLGLVIEESKWRISKVEKLQVDRSTWLRQRSSRAQRVTSSTAPDPGDRDVIHEFRPWLGEAYYRRYFQQMDQLARDIAAVLQEMMRQSRSSAIAPGPPPSPGMAVYLAETTSDMEEYAEEIRRELTDRGYVVLPPEDLAYRVKDFKQQVREYLKRSVMSIHPIGSQFGLTFEGEEKSRDWLQHDLAMERAAEPGFRRLVWVPASSQGKDPRQSKFIEYLTEDPAAQYGADIFTTTLADLKTNIENRLRDIRRQREKPVVAAPAARPVATATPSRKDASPVRIYIICDSEDQGSPGLAALRKYLFQQGYEPIVPSEAEDEREGLQEHTENLALCDAFMIYWGAGSNHWFLAKLRDFRKSLSQRSGSVLARAVYIDGPATAAKDALETHEADVVRAGQSFAPELLGSFLSKLDGAAKSETA